jgi:hypothetical protein
VGVLFGDFFVTVVLDGIIYDFRKFI